MDKPDLFISHASEDKREFVRPLAKALQRLGVRVWYDEFELKVGDSLSRSIDKGLVACQFGLVVLSPSFLQKNWPEYELRGLTAKEMAGGKVILPVWYGLGREQLLQWSPPLADKVAVVAEGKSIARIATEITSVVRPDLYTRICLRAARFTRKRDPQMIPIAQIDYGPPLHEGLPGELMNRIRLVRVALLDVHPQSMNHWVDGFRRDTHPSNEVRIWERIAACYLEFCEAHAPDDDQRHSAYSVLLTLSTGAPAEHVAESGEGLSDEIVLELVRSYTGDRPLRDLKDDLFPERYYATDSEIGRMARAERERFPDIPDDLVLELIKDLLPPEVDEE